jgi:DNA invertase Pin-like site-specific DNA recombinase
MIRAACYCRISSDPDDKREGVQRQREDTTALCEVKGWTPAGFYVDNDRSASNGKKREKWEELLADIQAGKINAIAAWDQDRNWRVMSELEELRRFFTTLGRQIPLATTGQGEIDLYSPTGVLTAQIKTAVSEHEVAMMKVRMRRAAKQKAEQGIPHWRNAFGYLPDGSHQPDPQTAPLVKQAYADILAGASLNDVTRMLNDAGTLGLTGKPWTATTVRIFLRKPRNAGLRAHNGVILGQGTWPGLVEETVWRSAQDALTARSGRPAAGRRASRRHVLTGVLLCGKPGCGGYLSGMPSTRGPICYACKRCRGISVLAEQVEPLVYGIVGGRLAAPDAQDLLKAEIHDEAEAESIRLELATLYAEVENIGVERGQRLLTGPQAKIATDLINADIAALERKQQDQERLRVFQDLPLGRPEVLDAITRLSRDRFRAVVDVLATITVAPVGKGGNAFNPERVQVEWK